MKGYFLQLLSDFSFRHQELASKLVSLLDIDNG